MAVEPGQATAQDKGIGQQGLGLCILGVARQGQAGGLGDWTPLKINIGSGALVCMYVCNVCMYVRTYVCMSVCMYVMHVCMYVGR